MRSYIAFLIGCIALLAGCNPKLQQSRIVIPEHYAYDVRSNSDTVSLTEEWWHIFGDTTLNRLIDKALVQNRDIAIAISRIEEARAQIKVARSEFLPTFSLGIGAGVSDSGSSSVEQSYSIERYIGWEVPLFGSLRHTTAKAKAAASYAEWQYHGVRLSLAAEVATTYFTLLQYRRELDIAIQSSALRRESAVLIDSIYRRGMASGVNREQAYNLVYTAEADIPQYERAVRSTLISLNLLMGEQPDTLMPERWSLKLLDDYRPIDIPAGLPSDLMHRRPDIMEAYYQMAEAAAAVGIARSRRLPSISLTANGGIASPDIDKLFTSKALFWKTLASLSQPVFQFGALRRQEQTMRERYTQAMLQYEQSFDNALSEVETALMSIETYRRETARYRSLIESNRRITAMTMALYRSGMSAYLDVIDAERTLYNSQMQYSVLVAQQYINYVNLCKALGGGWRDGYKNTHK